jgi:prephenate dehydrogenase
MSKKIAIIGLSQVGVSMGMALAGNGQDYFTMGLDRNGDVIREASKLKIFDDLTNKLPDLLANAVIVVLAVPFDEVEITLQAIAPLLPENSVVLDTSPVKRAVFDWAKHYLTPSTQFQSFTPIINPSHLLKAQSGMQAASKELFQGGLFLLCGREGITSESTGMATDLADALGGAVYYSDASELDGLLAAYELLPKLTAAAFFNSVSDEGGWHYGQKLTNSAFSLISRPLAELDEREAFGSAALSNLENTLRVLDNLIRELQTLRKYLAEANSEGLKQKIKQAKTIYSEWWDQRIRGDWTASSIKNPREEDGFWSGVMGMPSLKKKK